MFNSIVEAVMHYAEVQPDRLCLADDVKKVSYSEYADLIKRYAGLLWKMNIRKNDKVVVEASQTVDYLAMGLGIQLIGAVFVPVEHNCASDKIISFSERVSAKIVIVCDGKELVMENCYTYSQLEELSDPAIMYIINEFPTREDICEILFSTGTTGKEKGIVIMHKNNIALAENVMYGVRMDKDNVEMIPSPLNHSHGLRRYYSNMYNGSSVIVLGSVLNAKKFFINMDLYGVNSMDLVPSALSVLLKLTKDKLAEYKEHIRYIQFGAAPMMEADKIKIRELLPKTRLYNFYGSTESGCICIYDFNRINDKEHCIGKPAHNARIIIVDAERVEINSSKDNTGLLACSGNMNMLEYWNDVEETERVLSNGVIYSNDVAYFDEEGDIILLGRKGDVINVGGNKVSPEEIENIVKTMSVIEDCGVIPVEDAMKGFVPKLFVQIRKDAEFDPIAIRNYIASKLEPYKVPVYIERIELIPRSYNGKLLRKELK